MGAKSVRWPYPSSVVFLTPAPSRAAVIMLCKGAKHTETVKLPHTQHPRERGVNEWSSAISTHTHSESFNELSI